MDQSPIKEFEELTHDLPRFEDGRVDYTNAQKAPTVICIPYYQGKILIAKRSDKVMAYRGLWNGISGFIDEPISPYDVALKELTEELSLDQSAIEQLTVCEPYEINDDSIGRTWLVYPILANLNRIDTINIDQEHTNVTWIEPAELSEFPYTPGLDISVARVLQKV